MFISFPRSLKTERINPDCLSSFFRPNPKGVAIRLEITHFIVGLLESLISMNKLHALIFPYGSVPVRTFLPDADLDISVISLRKDVQKPATSKTSTELVAEKAREDKQNSMAIQFIYRTMRAFETKGGTEATRGHKIEAVKLIKARVKLITCRVDGFEVDISFQKESGIYKVILFEEFDRVFSDLNNKLHMVKEYIILAKAWFTYEARAMGGNRGLLSSYALEILVVCIMNNFWDEVQTPGRFLRKFFEYYANFDWNSEVLTLYGSVEKPSAGEQIKRFRGDQSSLPITASKVANLLKQCSIPVLWQSNGFQMGKMSVQDPLDHSNNITYAINENTYDRMVKVFKYGHKKIEDLLLRRECTRPQCTHELFPCSHWILDRCKDMERDRYFRLFDANKDKTPAGDVLAGDMQLFQKYASYYHSVVRPEL